MTVRVSRTFAFDVPGEQIWSFIADPEKRAGAISVVDSYDIHDENRATWHVQLPIPLVLSLIHTPSPRDRQKSRMPSSA